jgi:hypothetical protein
MQPKTDILRQYLTAAALGLAGAGLIVWAVMHFGNPINLPQ